MARSPVNENQRGADEGASLQQLERGLAVIQAFSREHPALSISDVARMTGVTRAAARRILLTLEKLGHVRSQGRLFSLTPKVLNLGWAYLSSLNLWEIARPAMEDLVEATGESCSASTLDPPDIVYVARVPTRHLMTNALIVGARLPAHATSHGRVLLADLSEEELDDFLASYPLTPYTSRTNTDLKRFRQLLADIRKQGWTITDQEYEIGLRSVATAVRGPDDRVIAALGISCLSARVSKKEMRTDFLPRLLDTAKTISEALGYASQGVSRPDAIRRRATGQAKLNTDLGPNRLLNSERAG